MARYATTDIKIEGTGKREFRNKLNTIAHEKIKGIEGLIPFENGKYVTRLKTTLQGGKIIKYKSGDLWVAEFRYRTKKLVEDGYSSRTTYISYEDLLEFEREMDINEVLGEETKLISHYAKRKPRKKLEKPFEMKVGDILYRYGDTVLVTKVTPRTFTFKYIEIEGTETREYPKEYIARIKNGRNGEAAWMTKYGSLITLSP